MHRPRWRSGLARQALFATMIAHHGGQVITARARLDDNRAMATPSSTRSQVTPQWPRWFAVAAGSLLLHVVMLGGVAKVIRFGTV